MSFVFDTPAADHPPFGRGDTVTISGGLPAPAEIQIKYPDGVFHGGFKIKIDALNMKWETTAGPFGDDHGDYLIKATGPGNKSSTRGFTVSD